MDEKIITIKEMLGELSSDSSVPQNIRKGAENISKLLSNEDESLETRKNKAFQLLEDMVSDINIDLYTRNNLYNTIAMVESLNGEV